MEKLTVKELLTQFFPVYLLTSHEALLFFLKYGPRTSCGADEQDPRGFSGIWQDIIPVTEVKQKIHSDTDTKRVDLATHGLSPWPSTPEATPQLSQATLQFPVKNHLLT